MNSWVPRRGGGGLAPPSPPPPRTSGRQNFSAKHLVPTPYSIQIESPPGASKMPQDASWAVLETIWGPIWGRIGAPDLPQIVCFPFAFVDFHTSSRFYENPQNPKKMATDPLVLVPGKRFAAFWWPLPRNGSPVPPAPPGFHFFSTFPPPSVAPHSLHPLGSTFCVHIPSPMGCTP